MVLLKAGEQIIKEEQVTMVVSGRTHSGGKLILTNKRVIYEIVQKGGLGGLLGGGGTTTALDKSLQEIQNVSENKPLLKIPFVTKNILMIEFLGMGRVDFAVKDPTAWNGVVIQTKSGHEQAMETVRSHDEAKELEKELMLRRAGASNISIGNTAPQPQVITREIVRIPCKYCGQLVENTAMKCPRCSAPLQ